MTTRKPAAAAKARIVRTHPWKAPNGEIFQARVPTTMQLLLFFDGVSDEDGEGTLRTVLKFLKNTFKDDDEYDRLVELVDEGVVDLPDIIGDGSESGETEEGTKSLIAQLSEAAAGGRPTQSSDDSSTRSSATPGKRSTGRSPGKGSTRSNSRSTAS